MLEFLGTALLEKIPKGATDASFAKLCGVSDERAKELISAMTDAKHSAYSAGPASEEHGLPTQQFSAIAMLQNAEMDLNTLGEIMLTGIMIGQICYEVDQHAERNNRRIAKMLALMASDPAKALRKMTKDLAKAAKLDKSRK